MLGQTQGLCDYLHHCGPEVSRTATALVLNWQQLPVRPFLDSVRQAMDPESLRVEGDAVMNPKSATAIQTRLIDVCMHRITLGRQMIIGPCTFEDERRLRRTVRVVLQD